MKRCLYCLPLLGLAPLLYFLAFYLDGMGILPRGYGLFIGAGSVVIVPPVVSLVLSYLPNFNWVIRGAIGICAFVAQYVLLFTVDHPGATYEMMGTAHRLRREFPPQQLHDCAEQLLQMYHAGTLGVSTNAVNDDYSFPGIINGPVMVVTNAALPVSLQGRFQRIFVQQNWNTGDDQIVFVLNRETGFICDNRKNVHDFIECSIGDGVEAYSLQRG